MQEVPAIRKELAISRLATAQHGVVATRQLLALGMSTSAINRRAAAGRLHRIHRGVYAVGHRSLTVQARWMAAVLACPPGALLSHRSAAALWGIRPTSRSRVEVIGDGASRRGIEVRRIAGIEGTFRQRIPVTTPTRTLFDLGQVLPADRLELAWDEADRLGLLNLAAVGRESQRRGGAPLRRLLERHRPEAAFTRSPPERKFLAMCRAACLPRPLVNHNVLGHEVDFYWPQQRLIVEIDGYEFHRTRLKFEQDRARDVELTLAGHTVLRFESQQLDDAIAASAAALSPASDSARVGRAARPASR